MNDKIKDETREKLLHIVYELNQKGYNFKIINGCYTIVDVERTYDDIERFFFNNTYSNIKIINRILLVTYKTNIEEFTTYIPTIDNYEAIDYRIHLLYNYTISNKFVYSFIPTNNTINHNAKSHTKDSNLTN